MAVERWCVLDAVFLDAIVELDFKVQVVYGTIYLVKAHGHNYATDLATTVLLKTSVQTSVQTAFQTSVKTSASVQSSALRYP